MNRDLRYVLHLLTRSYELEAAGDEPYNELQDIIDDAVNYIGEVITHEQLTNRSEGTEERTDSNRSDRLLPRRFGGSRRAESDW